MNRIAAGYCTVANPRNPVQVSRVSLQPDDVDAIVFWTRFPRPLLPHLTELDRRGYRYYVQFTLVDYPRAIEPRVPAVQNALATFLALAEHVGPDRVIWRYDPIVLSPRTRTDWHLETYERLAHALRGATHQSVISLMDEYRKTRHRTQALARDGLPISGGFVERDPELAHMLRGMAQAASACGMEIVSCAEPEDLRPFGIEPGRCVDDRLIRRVFGIDVDARKDPSQRAACGCVVSKDIGAYNTCLFGCQYCYATSNFTTARGNYHRHDPGAPAL